MPSRSRRAVGGYRAIYPPRIKPIAELAHARADGTYPRLLAKLARADVLLRDDCRVRSARRTVPVE